MADVVITCVHRAVVLKGKQVVKQNDGSLTEIELTFNRCNRCDTNWASDSPEPEVTIARMKTA